LAANKPAVIEELSWLEPAHVGFGITTPSIDEAKQ
jgi:hypothetical protein